MTIASEADALVAQPALTARTAAAFGTTHSAGLLRHSHLEFGAKAVARVVAPEHEQRRSDF